MEYSALIGLLLTSLQATMTVSHASRDDAGDVDGGVLLLATHHVEAQPLLCLGQLHLIG